MAELTPTQMKRAYEYAQKEKGGDRLTTSDIKNATKYIQSMDKMKQQKNSSKYPEIKATAAKAGGYMKKKGGGMAQRGMGAALKKGGMTKARAGKMMNMSMVAKKKRGKK